MAKYSPARTVQKSVTVGIIPVLVGELLPVIVPTMDRGNSYAIGSAALAVITGFINWVKNRKKAV